MIRPHHRLHRSNRSDQKGMGKMSTHESISENSGQQQGEPPAFNRRRLLEAGFWASTGITGLALAGGGVRFLVGDALKPPKQQWVKVGEVDALPAGQVHQITYAKRNKDAWRSVERPGLLYAYSADGADYTVLDATCTHLGCNVHWKAESERFYCACHDAYFSREGDVISGPPPTALVRRQAKIEDGALLVLL
jgi:Rieske Fe-S protein